MFAKVVADLGFIGIIMGALIGSKVAYEMLPLPLFLVVAAIVVGLILMFKGSKGKVSERSSKKADKTAETLIAEVEQQELKAKEAAAKQQAAKDKKAANKAKTDARKTQLEQEAKARARAEEAAAAAAAVAAAAVAPAGGEKKKKAKKEKAAPESDDDDDFALRAAQMGMARKKAVGKK